MNRLAFVALLVLSACSPDRPVAHLAAPPHEPQYSPWVLEVESAQASFDEISFKDVGLVSVGPGERTQVYERIAESLAHELTGHSELAMSSHVRFSEAMSDPSNHLSCMSRHVYVDLWESQTPDRIGYSLWSGCGEGDRFAWEEIERPRDDSGAIASLTRSIAGSLREAVRTGCFQRAC